MARRVDFPQIEYEPEYYDRPPRRRRGSVIGHFAIGLSLLAIGAVAAFVAVLIFGDSIPGMKRGPSVQQAAATQTDVPQDSPIGLQAKTWGVETCLGQIVNLSGFLTQRSNSQWLLNRGPNDANKEMFSATIASQENATGLRGISNLYAAPAGKDACNAAYQSTIYLPATCEQSRQAIFSGFTQRLDLGSPFVQAFAMPNGSARVYMMPAGANGCVAVKTESFY